MAGFGIDTSIAFQSTPPVKAATQLVGGVETLFKFQSTPPVKAATRADGNAVWCVFISIHAAREGGDGCAYRDCYHG